uniref:Papilin n=1 Tax=Jaculus jaculus TaxID=51337 RepID=A0A8C5JYW4_JACJA
APGAWSALNVRLQGDTWGPWGEWSPCSRTCGVGISFRERPCYSQSRFREKAWFGVGFCAGLSFPSLVYPAPNKCELNCIPRGENFYYKHREAVVDGTPCEPGKRDVCVDGSCRVVGCDHKLDSSKQEDKCLQCGGDGSTCYAVTGTFDASDLSRGYNQIFIVPMGATSIRIEEAAASRNFLAVKSVRGEYYLNGHWTIEEAQALPVASTILQYDRGAEGDLAPEQLLARGPTSEPLVIELISQEPSAGVHYQYYLPLTEPGRASRWSHSSWGDCSAQCGGGEAQGPGRSGKAGGTEASLSIALPSRQPRSQGHRNVGPWAPCSASCGGGSQSRSVYCVSSDGAGDQEATEDAQCAGLPRKPPATQACNLRPCAAWSAGHWGECSATCGAGIRRRSVTCRGEDGTLLPAVACSLEDQPSLTEACVREACPLLREQPWHASAWGLCSKSCGSGTRRRQVVCAIRPPGHCGGLQQSKPAEVEPCNRQPCHLPQEVPSLQDSHTHPRDPRMPLGPRVAPASDPRDQRRAAEERPWIQSNSRVNQGPQLPPGQDPPLQQPPYRPPPRYLSGARDCRHSPHGCCPDGHTPSLGPQWQGCPLAGASCQHSRYGCCPDGVSMAEGPQQAGCARSHGGGKSGSRPGSRAVASRVRGLELPRDHHGTMSKARGAEAIVHLGEVFHSCSTAYPVGCLLPSAHGSCTDWAARWYFVASVGQCNRFWYGGCHGNANNFASEQECMSSCRGHQEPRHPEPGASGHHVHTDGSHGGPGGQPEPGWHRTGATVPRLPSPSGGPWWREQEPRPAEAAHTGAFGARPGGQELRPGVPGLGEDAGRPVPPSYSNSHRISLAGSEASLVQTAVGQLVQLFCPSDASLEFQAGWQKDGRPISSERKTWAARPILEGPKYSHGPPLPPGDSFSGLLAGGDVAMLPGTEPRHFPQTRGPGHGSTSSSHLRPATRLRMDRTQPGVVDASLGQRIRLTCHTEGFPPPTIEWQRDGQPVSSSRHQLQPDGSLVISRVAVEDGGFYTCVAFNGQDRDQRWVQLRVLGELTITGLPPAVTVPEGDTARLLCMVAGESVNIRWSRNGLPVQADGHRVHQSPDGTLLIHNLQPKDEGSYTCSAYRGSQAVSRSTEVKVAVPAAAQSRDPSQECTDQPELANCALILQAQLCGNEYYSSFCCASCSRFQPPAQPAWQQG